MLATPLRATQKRTAPVLETNTFVAAYAPPPRAMNSANVAVTLA
jgi:hypothetical protein